MIDDELLGGHQKIIGPPSSPCLVLLISSKWNSKGGLLWRSEAQECFHSRGPSLWALCNVGDKMINVENDIRDFVPAMLVDDHSERQIRYVWLCVKSHS